MSEGEGPKKKGFKSEDAKKLNDFYTFKMGEDKFQEMKKRTGRNLWRIGLMGVIFGFGTEWLLGNGQIYDNIVKRSTLRRLST